MARQSAQVDTDPAGRAEPETNEAEGTAKTGGTLLKVKWPMGRFEIPGDDDTRVVVTDQPAAFPKARVEEIKEAGKRAGVTILEVQEEK